MKHRRRHFQNSRRLPIPKRVPRRQEETFYTLERSPQGSPQGPPQRERFYQQPREPYKTDYPAKNGYQTPTEDKLPQTRVHSTTFTFGLILLVIVGIGMFFKIRSRDQIC